MTTKPDNRTILFIPDPPIYGIRAESIQTINTSIFADVYNAALENVGEIIHSNQSLSKNNNQTLAKEKLNPIIAFTGNRGTGKSTAMTSFATMLGNVPEGSELDNAGLDKPQKDILKENKFFSLPVIDSAQLGKSETILGRMTAGMYEYFESIKYKCSYEQKQDFYKQARRVNELAVMYRTGAWFRKNDALLNDTHSISIIEKRVHELIECFLRITGAGNDLSHAYLVISIDDLDMSIINSYAIMEEIRKFMFIPNLIILITMHTEQLELIFKSTFTKELAADKNQSIADMALIDDLSYRYYDKLFPYNKCHDMPQLTSENLLTLQSANFVKPFPNLNEEYKAWNDWLLSVTPNIKDVPSLQTTPNVLYATLYLIWRKTLLIPVCDEEGNNLLVPRNLRSLCNMIVFLRAMPDPFTDDSIHDLPHFFAQPQNKQILKQNLEHFEAFLVKNLKIFENNALNKDEVLVAQILEKLISDFQFLTLTTMNAKIVGDILYQLSTQGNSSYHKALLGFNNKSDIIDLSKVAQTSPRSVGMSDVMFVLNKLYSGTRCQYVKYLVEVIRTLWSIRMTKEFYIEGITPDGAEVRLTQTVTGGAFRQTVGDLIITPQDITLAKRSEIFNEKQPADNKKESPSTEATTDDKEKFSSTEAAADDKDKSSSSNNMHADPKDNQNTTDIFPQSYKYAKLDNPPQNPLNHYLSHAFPVFSNGLDSATIALPLFSMNFVSRYCEDIYDGFKQDTPCELDKVEKKLLQRTKLYFENNTLYPDSIPNATPEFPTYLPKSIWNFYLQNLAKLYPGPLKKRKKAEPSSEADNLIKQLKYIFKNIKNLNVVDALLDLLSKNTITNDNYRKTIEVLIKQAKQWDSKTTLKTKRELFAATIQKIEQGV